MMMMMMSCLEDDDMLLFIDDVSVLLVRNTRGSGIHTHKSSLTHTLFTHTPPANIPPNHPAHTHIHTHSSCPSSRANMKSELTHPII